MGRPRLAITSAEISAEIARLQNAAQAQVRQLEERRRAAQIRENERRGELIMSYLERASGADLRRVLGALVDPADRQLFALDEARAEMPPTI